MIVDIWAHVITKKDLLSEPWFWHVLLCHWQIQFLFLFFVIFLFHLFLGNSGRTLCPLRLSQRYLLVLLWQLPCLAVCGMAASHCHLSPHSSPGLPAMSPIVMLGSVDFWTPGWNSEQIWKNLNGGLWGTFRSFLPPWAVHHPLFPHESTSVTSSNLDFSFPDTVFYLSEHFLESPAKLIVTSGFFFLCSSPHICTKKA